MANSTHSKISLPVVIALSILLAVIGVYGFSRSQQKTFTAQKEKYTISLPEQWQSKQRESGTIFVDQNGKDRLEILVFDDKEMTERFLHSDVLAERIRGSYHEAYEVDEDAIKISPVQLAGYDALQVRYSPEPAQLRYLNGLSGSGLTGKNLTDFYIYKNGITYVVRLNSDDKQALRYSKNIIVID